VEEPQETQDQTGEESSGRCQVCRTDQIAEKCYQNEKMEQYKGMLVALNQRVADVQTSSQKSSID
jgi:hypothetical protein